MKRYDFHALLRFDAKTLAAIELMHDVIETERDEASESAYQHGVQDGMELVDSEQDRARRRR